MGLSSRIKRILRRRGYGVHSPFVYTLLRAIYQGRNLLGGDVCGELIDAGVACGVARELEIVMHECGYSSWSINRVGDAGMIICHHLRSEEIDSFVSLCRDSGATLAIIPRKEGGRVVDNHLSTSIQARGYTLLFNNGLPKQNFEI